MPYRAVRWRLFRARFAPCRKRRTLDLPMKASDQSNCESKSSDSLNRMPCVVWPRVAFGLGASNPLVFNLQPIAFTRRSRIMLMPAIGTPRIGQAPSYPCVSHPSDPEIIEPPLTAHDPRDAMIHRSRSFAFDPRPSHKVSLEQVSIQPMPNRRSNFKNFTPVTVSTALGHCPASTRRRDAVASPRRHAPIEGSHPRRDGCGGLKASRQLPNVPATSP